ncbi:spermatogenesis-associated protein 20-like isoform X2 [Lineus longissimus]|uniref:spermatogenesis-associated protein 20-like isoform X2 n=1 Tax=Lineus longissimus TaxID=88925 RepID=UPI002B4EAB2C
MYLILHPLFIQAMALSSTEPQFQNRLISEKSPYLLQHAHNPVDWYPWGNEAFEKAKAENMMIFLSVGYSTCHWCHVMERESFENIEISKVMNENFVCIKVDREERPDVDRVYMTFIQATSGGGGWPMSVWLTPDLKPVVGGTYFPPDDRYYGRPGFKSVLQGLAQQWVLKKSKLSEQGTVMLDALMQGTSTVADPSNSLPDKAAVNKCFQQLIKSYDKQLGGYGKAPKFPQPVNFTYMFRFYAKHSETDAGQLALESALHTLRMMAKGGIYDHIAQGFHRYSTDARWHVPHFEKMLYDQGQLASVYAEAYQISEDEFFANVAKEILQYVGRDLSDKNGGFYSAEDADSFPTDGAKDKKEGAFCVWTHGEIKEALHRKLPSDESITFADIFCKHYGVSTQGNVDPAQDPHDELKNQNVLKVDGDLETTASQFGLESQIAKKILAECRDILFEIRKKRPPPGLDNKMLTAWNGLMISGFSKCSQAMHEPAFAKRAAEAAEFIKTHMYNASTGKLLRSSYAGPDGEIKQISTPIEGFVDDYAFLIRGLIDLYEACFDSKWLEWAEALQTKQDELFWDTEGGGYFSSDANDSSIVLRMKEDQDGAEPSGNSVSIGNLLRLSQYLDNDSWRQQANKLLLTFHSRITQIPVAVPEMVSALMYHLANPKQIIIAGDMDSPDTQALLKCVHSHFLPNKIVVLADNKPENFLYKKLKILESLEKKEGKATAYVCQDFVCKLPVNTVEELEELLE